MSPVNHQVRLAARPSGLPQDSDWELRVQDVPEPGAGEFVVEISHLSLDPAMRGWMNAGASYIDPVEVGDVMRAGAVGTVSASEHCGFAVGEHVYGVFGVQEYALSDGKGVIKIDPSLAPPPTYLGTLGMTGMVVFDYANRFSEAMADIAGWMREGRIVSREHIVDGGISAFPDALLKLFAGENTGKLVLRVGAG